MDNLKEIAQTAGSGVGGVLATIYVMARANKKRIEEVKTELQEKLDKETEAIKDNLEKEIKVMKEYVDEKHDDVKEQFREIKEMLGKIFDKLYEFKK